MRTFNFFPTPVYCDILNLDNRQLEKEIREFAINTPSKTFSNIGGYQGELFHNEEWINAITEACPRREDKPIQEYSIFTWANVNSKGHRNQRHVHLDTSIFLSGVYYVKVPENSGRIRFYDPRGPLMTCMPDHEYFNDGHEYHYIDPEEGMVLFFPCWLEHDVEENDSDEDRISIAFNIFADINNDK